MQSRADYVLLEGDDNLDVQAIEIAEEKTDSTTDIFKNLSIREPNIALTTTISVPVVVPEIMVSQHLNAMRFYNVRYQAVKAALQNTSAVRNAALDQLSRLEKLLTTNNTAYMLANLLHELSEDSTIPFMEYSPKTSLQELGKNRLVQLKATLRTQSAECRRLATESKELARQIRYHNAEIEKYEPLEAQQQAPEEPTGDNRYTYLAMPH